MLVTVGPLESTIGQAILEPSSEAEIIPTKMLHIYVYIYIYIRIYIYICFFHVCMIINFE